MKNIEVKFGIGDIVCPVCEAENGKIERTKVVGIDLRLDEVRNYFTESGYYRESQLVSEAEALELAIAYHERQAEMLRKEAEKSES